MSKGKLHVTYTVSNVVYYSSYDGDWSDRQTVSVDETGFKPRIAAWNYGSDDKVYFLYQKSNEAKWVEYDVSEEDWGTLYSAFSMDNLYTSGFRIDGSNIVIYFRWYDTGIYRFAWKVFSLNNSFIRNGNADFGIVNDRMYSTSTVNGESHTVFHFTDLGGEEDSDVGLWRSSDGASIPYDQFYEYQYPTEEIYHINLSSASNDVHVIWQDTLGSNNGNNLRYIYDDQDPLAPTNLDVEKSKDDHPYLSWDANNEPDIDTYNIYKFVNDWQYFTSTSNTYYEDTGEDYCTAPPPAQCTNEHNISYKITAEDLGDNESGYSNTVIARVLGGAPSKYNSGNSSTSNVTEYSLSQNYPNPFNPATQITYSLAQDADVSIKVYDMLGMEVANLVNSTQPAGEYELNFNAENLASGVYIYRITASKNGIVQFSNSKQMILLR